MEPHPAADAFEATIKRVHPEWSADMVDEPLRNDSRLRFFRIPSANPNVSKPLRVCCDYCVFGDFAVAWVEGHHKHAFYHDFGSLEEAIDAVVQCAEHWMTDDLILRTLYRNGKKAMQSQRFLDVEYPARIAEWSARFGMPDEPGPNEFIRTLSWFGTHDRVQGAR